MNGLSRVAATHSSAITTTPQSRTFDVKTKNKIKNIAVNLLSSNTDISVPNSTCLPDLWKMSAYTKEKNIQ